MKRRTAILGSALFFVAAPGTFAGLLPWLRTHWHMQPPFFGFAGLRIAGGLLIGAGLYFLLDSFARFALKGLGTPAPIAPPEKLVVSGYYRHTRNPMYVAVLALISGQALLFGDVFLIAYGVLVWFCFEVFVMGYEEPTLRRMFGAEYERYCENVPRWFPRLRPWSP
ncbi:MAG TPA: isoprenylcysteine carboxylmethyltransferase family protein [Rhizomicrobium sp.]|nr:isoprenylcysteine carboxylmethyltransferase family protein [Rhizomicrobium sp.]